MHRTYNIEHHVNHGHHVFMIVIKQGFNTERFIVPAAWAAFAVLLAIGVIAVLISVIRSLIKRLRAAK